MKMIKNTITFLFLAGAFGFTGYTLYQYTLEPCEKPLEYSLGRFDAEFGVSKEEFLKRIAIAETVWEKTLGRDIFSYNPEGSFKINLIYDERQQTTNQKQRVESGLEAAESAFKKLDTEFNKTKANYDGRVENHEKEVAYFENRQREYDAKVEYWNSRGGAPKGEYEKLQKEASELNAEVSRLNVEAATINKASTELNTLLEARNKAAENYNKVAREYNQKFGHGLEFNQAEYIGNPNFNRDGEINVYQFGSGNDLTLALSHELGHALGMDHVENPKSIMYYETGTNTESNLKPTTEDLAELRRVCK